MTTDLHLDPKELLSLSLPEQTFSIFWPHACFSISSILGFSSCARKRLNTQSLFYLNMSKADFPVSGHNWWWKNVRRDIDCFSQKLKGPCQWVIVVQSCRSKAKEHLSPWYLGLNHNTHDSIWRWVFGSLCLVCKIYLLRCINSPNRWLNMYLTQWNKCWVLLNLGHLFIHKQSVLNIGGPALKELMW